VGDAARAIHWRRTAALGKLVVLERHDDETSHVTLLLDNAKPTGAGERWDEAFERAISRTAAIAIAAAGRELRLEVICRGSRSPQLLPGGSADPVLRYLALLSTVPAQDAPAFARVGAGTRVIEMPITPLAA
jgi:uncharacterized protein (DUF58 family)